MHIYGIYKEGNNKPVCKTAKETQMYWIVFWTLWERVRVGWVGRMALKHVCYHMWNESPVQVWCMIQGAQGWCTGMTQRDGMRREEGGGFRMGNTCTLMADSSKCITKPMQQCKGKKKKKKDMHISPINIHTHWSNNFISENLFWYYLQKSIILNVEKYLLHKDVSFGSVYHRKTESNQ